MSWSPRSSPHPCYIRKIFWYNKLKKSLVGALFCPIFFTILCKYQNTWKFFSDEIPYKMKNSQVSESCSFLWNTPTKNFTKKFCYNKLKKSFVGALCCPNIFYHSAQIAKYLKNFSTEIPLKMKNSIVKSWWSQDKKC